MALLGTYVTAKLLSGEIRQGYLQKGKPLRIKLSTGLIHNINPDYSVVENQSVTNRLLRRV